MAMLQAKVLSKINTHAGEHFLMHISDVRVMVTKVMTKQQNGLFDQDAVMELLQFSGNTTKVLQSI